jgi:hypothetical protein
MSKQNLSILIFPKKHLARNAKDGKAALFIRLTIDGKVSEISLSRKFFLNIGMRKRSRF